MTQNVDAFIDSGVLVGLYEVSKESLAEVEILLSLVESKQVTLWLPEQAKREFWKNREKNIRAALGEFEKPPGPRAVPVLARAHPEFAALMQGMTETDKLRRKISDDVRGEIEREETKADVVVRKVFEQATIVDTDRDDIFQAAHRRALAHLPPGKRADLGDRLNWVGLLSDVPDGTDLDVIAIDGDWADSASPAMIRPYLAAEWTKKKAATVTLWKRLSQFLATKFPWAKSAQEVEREMLTRDLESSMNFAATHVAVGGLTPLVPQLNSGQVHRVVAAGITNRQVNWILADDDVSAFYRKVLEEHGALVGDTEKTALEGQV